jgi:hypothetical protein
MSIDDKTSKRLRCEDASETESGSSYSESGGGTSPVGRLSQNSASKPTLGEPQNNFDAPTRRTTRVTRTEKDFFVSCSTRRQAFPTKHPDTSLAKRPSQIRRDSRF